MRLRVASFFSVTSPHPWQYFQFRIVRVNLCGTGVLGSSGAVGCVRFRFLPTSVERDAELLRQAQ